MMRVHPVAWMFFFFAGRLYAVALDCTQFSRSSLSGTYQGALVRSFGRDSNDMPRPLAHIPEGADRSMDMGPPFGVAPYLQDMSFGE